MLQSRKDAPSDPRLLRNTYHYAMKFTAREDMSMCNCVPESKHIPFRSCLPLRGVRNSLNINILILTPLLAIKLHFLNRNTPNMLVPTSTGSLTQLSLYNYE